MTLSKWRVNGDQRDLKESDREKEKSQLKKQANCFLNKFKMSKLKKKQIPKWVNSKTMSTEGPI